MKENLSSNNSFSFAHWLFGRSLGLVTFIAFLSYWVQADSIIGVKGLSLGKVIFKKSSHSSNQATRSNQVLTSPNPFMVFNFFQSSPSFQLGCILIPLPHHWFHSSAVRVSVLDNVLITKCCRRTLPKLSMGCTSFGNPFSFTPISSLDFYSSIFQSCSIFKMGQNSYIIVARKINV